MVVDAWNLLWERKDFFLELIIQHLLISACAIVIAIVLGGLTGILTGEIRKLSRPVIGAVNILYTIPSISMLGFLIPATGIGNTTAVIALSIYALLPMVRNTFTGLTNVEPTIIEAAEGMGSTRLQILYKIKLPLAMPVIMSGIRNMVIMTLAMAGVASFIGAGGLGVAIYRGITTNNAAMTIDGSLLIAIIAVAADLLLSLLEKLCERKNRQNKTRRRAVLSGIVLVFILLAVFTSFGRKKGDTIRIATKPMTEQYILGEMLGLLIEENTDLNVEISHGIGGGTSNIQPAMESGEFDLYPEYTGTGWSTVLKKDSVYQSKDQEELKKEYEEQYDMIWIGMYGFADNYALAVQSELAEEYGLKDISDLKGIASSLVLGAEYDFFEREDGYYPLCETYGFSFQDTVDLDVGLKYQAARQKEVDVMPIFTTDGQLSVSELTVLNDDKNFYPSYDCCNVVRGAVLEAHPELEEVLLMTEGILSDEKMAELNYRVDVEGDEPADVAADYLREIGLVR